MSSIYPGVYQEISSIADAEAMTSTQWASGTYKHVYIPGFGILDWDATSTAAVGDGVHYAASDAPAVGRIIRTTATQADLLSAQDDAMTALDNAATAQATADAAVPKTGYTGTVDLSAAAVTIANATTSNQPVSKTQLDAVQAIATTGRIADLAKVATVATTNITLSGEQNINGLLTSASRVLCIAQSIQSQNRIWVTGAGTWTAATDADSAAELGLATIEVDATASTLAGQRYQCPLTSAQITAGGGVGTVAIPPWTNIGTNAAAAAVAAEAAVRAEAIDTESTNRRVADFAIYRGSTYKSDAVYDTGASNLVNSLIGAAASSFVAMALCAEDGNIAPGTPIYSTSTDIQVSASAAGIVSKIWRRAATSPHVNTYPPSTTSDWSSVGGEILDTVYIPSTDFSNYGVTAGAVGVVRIEIPRNSIIVAEDGFWYFEERYSVNAGGARIETGSGRESTTQSTNDTTGYRKTVGGGWSVSATGRQTLRVNQRSGVSAEFVQSAEDVEKSLYQWEEVTDGTLYTDKYVSVSTGNLTDLTGFNVLVVPAVEGEQYRVRFQYVNGGALAQAIFRDADGAVLAYQGHGIDSTPQYYNLSTGVIAPCPPGTATIAFDTKAPSVPVVERKVRRAELMIGASGLGLVRKMKVLMVGTSIMQGDLTRNNTIPRVMNALIGADPDEVFVNVALGESLSRIGRSDLATVDDPDGWHGMDRANFLKTFSASITEMQDKIDNWAAYIPYLHGTNVPDTLDAGWIATAQRASYQYRLAPYFNGGADLIWTEHAHNDALCTAQLGFDSALSVAPSTPYNRSTFFGSMDYWLDDFLSGQSPGSVEVALWSHYSADDYPQIVAAQEAYAARRGYEIFQLYKSMGLVNRTITTSWWWDNATQLLYDTGTPASRAWLTASTKCLSLFDGIHLHSDRSGMQIWRAARLGVAWLISKYG